MASLDDILAAQRSAGDRYPRGHAHGEFKADGSVALTGDMDAGGQRISNIGILTLTLKTDTGYPSSPNEADVVVNTFDNKASIYADAAWRDFLTW